MSGVARGYMLLVAELSSIDRQVGNVDRSSPVFGEFAIGQTDMDFRNENEGVVLAKGVIYATKMVERRGARDESAIGDEDERFRSTAICR
ncbi:MAG: hypothetical protein IPK58_24770 [Acidobacteria bacterium]|nr:hypothetical protein [Acidobacteriota bacterium]